MSDQHFMHKDNIFIAIKHFAEELGGLVELTEPIDKKILIRL